MTKPSRVSNTIFIDEEINIYEGEQAAALIHAKADLEVSDASRGIVHVSWERWQEAQRYEKKTWLEIEVGADSDRNEYHQEHFANYAPIRGLAFRRGIELGCGPFTNTRFILEQCNINEIYLLDPLLQDYLNHPFCRYWGSRLGGSLKDFTRLNVLRRRKQVLRNLKNAHRIGGLMGKQVYLESLPIEMYKPNVTFDLVVMVNVIEHCQDAEVIFKKILEFLDPGGIFIFADKLYRAEEVQRLSSILYDAGHPLRIDRSVIDDFLNQHFDSLMHAEYFVEQNFRGIELDRYELYFIGKKRSY